MTIEKPSVPEYMVQCIENVTRHKSFIESDDIRLVIETAIELGFVEVRRKL